MVEDEARGGSIEDYHASSRSAFRSVAFVAVTDFRLIERLPLAILRKRAAEVYLVVSELSLLVAANKPLIALVEFDNFSFARHSSSTVNGRFLSCIVCALLDHSPGGIGGGVSASIRTVNVREIATGTAIGYAAPVQLSGRELRAMRRTLAASGPAWHCQQTFNTTDYAGSLHYDRAVP
jgi:hypothetical protein